MRFLKNVALIALVGIVCPMGAAQSGQARVFQGFYDRYNALILKRDVAGLTNLIKTSHSDDFIEIGRPNKAGKIKKSTRSQVIADMAGAFRIVDAFTAASTHIDHLKLGTASAEVTVTTNAAANIDKSPDRRHHTLTVRETNRDTWVKAGSSWKLKKSLVLANSITVDGKAVPAQ